MRFVRVSVLAILIVLMAGNVWSFDGMRKGFVLGGGLGFSPYASWSVSENIYGLNVQFSESGAGLGLNLIIGYAWDEFNMIVYEGNVAGWTSDLIDEQISQGINGASWYHYFGPQGKSFFTVAGLGFYVNQVGDYDQDDPGGAYLIGAGYEFTRHIQVALYISGGNTSSGGTSIGHNHVNLVVNAIAF